MQKKFRIPKRRGEQPLLLNNFQQPAYQRDMNIRNPQHEQRYLHYEYYPYKQQQARQHKDNSPADYHTAFADQQTFPNQIEHVSHSDISPPRRQKCCAHSAALMFRYASSPISARSLYTLMITSVADLSETFTT